MRDIKQEELDSRFVQGVLRVEAAIINSDFMSGPAIREACRTVRDLLIAEIGEARMAAIQGENAARHEV